MGAKPRVRRWTEERVLARVEYWKKRLRLADVRVTVVFGPDHEDQSTGACYAQPQYEEATIRFDLENIPPDQVEAHIIHELIHYPVWPLSSFTHRLCEGDEKLLYVLEEKEEAVTTYIERLVESLTRES